MRSPILTTPLRYPGGKSKWTKLLYEYLPDMRDYEEWREPFLGGGSMPIEITKRYPDMRIWVNDLYPALYNFWTQLQSSGSEMSEHLLKIKESCVSGDVAKTILGEQKEIINDDVSSDFDKAVAFYYANKSSFSGLTVTGTFSESSHEMSFTRQNIMKLVSFQKLIRNWKITNEDYSVLLEKSPKTFVYLDPPYELTKQNSNNLYGKRGSMHEGFNHDLFAKQCNESGMDCMISYNADQSVKDRFDGWEQAELDWTYTMQSVGDYMENQKDRKELLLLNYKVEQGSLETFFS
jgi:site-specific DNA-adenine methylase